jgi:hypothetical protein
MVGQMSPAVYTAVGPVTLVGQVGLERFHHPAGGAQTSNGGPCGELAVSQP